MGKRFHTYYPDEHGHDYDVEIHDTEFSGTSYEFDTAAPGPRISYNAQGQERFSGIMTSKITIPVEIKADTPNGGTSTVQGLVDDLKQSKEGRFFVKVLKDSAFFGVYVVQTEQAKEENMSFPYTFSLTATDGLARLKDTDYVPSGISQLGFESVLDHLINCLENSGVLDFYSTGQVFLTTTVNWIESNHDHSNGFEVLANTRFQHKVFTKQDQDGEYSYTKIFNVLKELANDWDARLYYTDGQFRFEQYNERRGVLPDFKEVRYDKEGTYIDFTLAADYDVTSDQTSGQAFLRGRTHEYYPALKEVCTTYKHESGTNHLDGYNIQSGSGGVNLGEFNYNNGDAKLSFAAHIRYTHSTTEDPTPAMVVWFRFRISVGGYYLKRTWNQPALPSAPSYTETEWVNEVAYYEILSPVHSQENYEFGFDVAFETPTFQESGDLIFKLETFALLQSSLASLLQPIIPGTVSWWLDNPSLAILDDGENFNDNERIYCVTNITTGGDENTAILDDVMLIGDGPKANTINRLQVKNAAGTWVNSGSWTRGPSGTGRLFQNLRLWERIIGQLKPVKQTLATAYLDMTARSRVADGEFQYLFASGTWTMATGHWAGEWWAIRADDTEAQVEPVDIPWTPPINPGGPPVVVPPVTFGYVLSDATTHGPIPAGPVTQIPIEVPTNGFQVYEGQSISVVDQITGYSMSVQVVQDSVAGDSVLYVSGTSGGQISSGSPIFVTNNPANTQNQPQTIDTIFITEQTGSDPESCGDQCPAIMDFCSLYTLPTTGDGSSDGYGYLIDATGFRLFEPGSADPTFFLRSADGVNVPTKKHHTELLQIVDAWTSWTTGVKGSFFVVPQRYDGLKVEKIGLGVSAAGSSGTSTLVIRKNGATAATVTVDQTERLKEYNFTEFTLAEFDNLDFNITGLSGTAPQGLIIYLFLNS